MAHKPTMEEFLAKIESYKEKAGVDLTMAEDLSIAVMNLVSLEEHFFFTAAKTKKDGYFDAMQQIRELRKTALQKLMPEHEGETWCISKHLLAATMRFMEVGTKLRSDGQKDEAKKMFESAYKVYGIFWALKVSLITGSTVKHEAAGLSAQAGSATLEDLVSKLAQCCDE